MNPYPTTMEVVLKLGPTAKIMVDTDPEGWPILAIDSPEINLLIMPYGASEGGPLTKCDAERGSDLVIAAIDYRNAIHAQLKGDAGGLPRRRRKPKAVKEQKPPQVAEKSPEALEPSSSPAS